MSFTDQKPRTATKEDLTAPWSGFKDGSHFYCKLCGYSFEEGDGWRWIYAGKKALPNLLVCAHCDGEDVLDLWVKLWKEWEELSKGKFRFVATLLKDCEYEQGQVRQWM